MDIRIAQWIAPTTGVVAGVWLIGLGVFMAVRPRRALDALAAMGSTPVVHFGEMGARVLTGCALALAAPASRLPAAISVIGWFLVVSAVVLMLAPRRWHAAYSVWWARRIPPAGVWLVAPLSVLGGALLIWTLVPTP